MMALKTGTLIPRMSEDTLKVDLIVIGGGPAGVVGATTAASMGKKVALVEHHTELGGAGANTGTVPSKTLRETALALSGVRSRGLYGVDLSLRREVTVADFLRHEQHVKAGLNHTISQRMDASNTEVYCGSAAFADSHTVGVGGDKPVSLQGDYFWSRRDRPRHARPGSRLDAAKSTIPIPSSSLIVCREQWPWWVRV